MELLVEYYFKPFDRIPIVSEHQCQIWTEAKQRGALLIAYFRGSKNFAYS
jgi:hypothetical protein